MIFVFLTESNDTDTYIISVRVAMNRKCKQNELRDGKQKVEQMKKGCEVHLDMNKSEGGHWADTERKHLSRHGSVL